jgi:hypothetical protein
MPTQHPPARSTKTELIRRALSRKSGSSLADLGTATGWQAHSLRAALSRLADWARSLLAKKPFKLVAVALANKMARI